MTTTAPAPPIADIKTTGLNALGFSRRVFEKLLADFPADKATVQPFPNANHAAWLIGHITTTDDWFRSGLGGQKKLCPEAWDKLFGMGSEPVGDASKYPSWSELTAKFKEVRQSLLQWFKSMDDAKLAEPLPEKVRGFAADYATLMSTAAAHEMMHVGQLSALRRAFGLPRALG